MIHPEVLADEADVYSDDSEECPPTLKCPTSGPAAERPIVVLT